MTDKPETDVIHASAVKAAVAKAHTEQLQAELLRRQIDTDEKNLARNKQVLAQLEQKLQAATK